MREAEAHQTDEVIASHQHQHQNQNRLQPRPQNHHQHQPWSRNQPQNHRPRSAAPEVTDRRGTRDGAEAAEPAPTTVLNAERGIINTGTVHGGQHVTTVEFRGHRGAGAGHDL